MRWTRAAALFVLFFFSTRCARADEVDLPNVVLIMADDMGYGDVHAYNQDSRIPTPSLDLLAAGGIAFTDAHSPSAVCTPTRYGLMTGRYCWRSRLKRGVLNGYGAPLIEPDRPTVASMLEGRGYTTGIVGKWHLGLGFAQKETGGFDFSRRVSVSPNQNGFGFSYVIPASLDFPPYLYVRNDQITKFPDLVQKAIKFPSFVRKGERASDFILDECLDHLLQEAIGFIRRSDKAKSPFFLYFPLTAPHKPVLPHPRFVAVTDLGPYGDFVVQVDTTVGQILEELDRLRIAENTLVIYTSDNGSFMHRRDAADAKDHVDDQTIQAYRSDRHRSNSDWRGTKADIWEAGHRVPFIVRWPGQVEAGSRSSQTICHTDIFATLAEMASVSLPVAAGEDSFSFLPELTGAEQASPRPPVIHHSGSGMFAIRKGDWKLVLGNGSGGRQAPKGKPFGRPYYLFNLQSDPGERRNLIEDQPEIALELEREFHQIQRSGRSR